MVASAIVSVAVVDRRAPGSINIQSVARVAGTVRYAWTVVEAVLVATTIGSLAVVDRCAICCVSIKRIVGIAGASNISSGGR